MVYISGWMVSGLWGEYLVDLFFWLVSAELYLFFCCKRMLRRKKSTVGPYLTQKIFSCENLIMA